MSLLQRLHAGPMLRTLRNPVTGQYYENRYFAVSASGCRRWAKKLHRSGISLFRCLDPIRWVLAYRRVIRDAGYPVRRRAHGDRYDADRRRKPGAGRDRVTVTVGVDADASLGYDADMSGYALDRDGKVISNQHFVYFNNAVTPDGDGRLQQAGLRADPDDRSGRHGPAGRAGRGRGHVHDAAVGFGRQRCPDHRAARRRGARRLQSQLGMPNARSVVYGRLARESDTWKFWAEGTGTPDLVATVASFGVTTS